MTTYRPTLTIWLLLLLLWGSGVRPAVAQLAEPSESASSELDQNDEEDLDEDDEVDDVEDEDSEAEEELRELHEYRQMLSERLTNQKAAIQSTQRRIREVEKFIVFAEQLAKLESDIRRAEEKEDERRVEALEAKFDKLEEQLDTRRELLEVEQELMEIEEMLGEADREEEFDRLDILKGIQAGLERIRKINTELLTDISPSKRELLEQEKAKVFTRKLEKGFRALELLEEIYEAEEEDDDELADELLQELEQLQSDINSGTKVNSDRSKKTSLSAPELRPIVVNAETLAPFANMDLLRDVAPLLQTYCFDCHSNESSSGELNFESLLSATPIVKERSRWINVIEQTKNHVMPPEDERQPTLEERRTIVLSLHNAIHNFDYSRVRNPGFESTRRLTHREYSNTIRDLFGIDIDVVDRFPDDLTASSGFDNSANSLFIQSMLMERYVGIAEHVVSTALPDVPKSASEKLAEQRIFAQTPPSPAQTKAAAEQIFWQFLLRAYRRPATTNEVARYSNQVVRAVNGGTNFKSAVKATLQTILITPSFLLLNESDQPKQTGAFRINDFELASRLSYFLWASMPDDELLELARQNKLSDPTVLQTQVTRMLDNAKSETLGSTFAAQWLGSHHLGVRVRLDPIDNPWCTETLMSAMRLETSMFFNSLIRSNRPITELITADYTFLNEELAKLYRIQGVQGAAMRKVSLKTNKRGGIFGQGSLLAVTSFPYRTSPVVRGKWILDNVLGTPPPPPPPNVSDLSEEVEENERLSFREKLELHRVKPNCYACHSQMDPLGFSLEQFDWFGRYRTRRGRRRIDAQGELPNGTKFDGISGLKQVIVDQRHDDLIRQVSSKMLSYALGRQLEFYDEVAIRGIVERVMNDNDRFRTLIHEIVKSYPFQYKQRPNTESHTTQQN